MISAYATYTTYKSWKNGPLLFIIYIIIYLYILIFIIHFHFPTSKTLKKFFIYRIQLIIVGPSTMPHLDETSIGWNCIKNNQLSQDSFLVPTYIFEHVPKTPIFLFICPSISMHVLGCFKEYLCILGLRNKRRRKNLV